jgi:galactokinase
LLAASHASLRDDYEVSSAELDTAVEAAVGSLARPGARMTGACASAAAPFALVRADPGRAGAPTGPGGLFAAAGFGSPEVTTVLPSDGARRLA